MLEIWYILLPSGPLPNLFSRRSQGQRCPQAGEGVLGSNHGMHRNIFKNLLLQNHLSLMLEIWYDAIIGEPQNCKNSGPGVQNVPRAAGLGFEIKYV